MVWRDAFFIWLGLEIRDPPTANQWEFWSRARAMGSFRYVLRGLLQDYLLVTLLMIAILGWLGINPARLWALGNLRLFLSLATPFALPTMMVIHRQSAWNKNERVYQDESTRRQPLNPVAGDG